MASFVKQALNIPVISVGRIDTPEVAESIIAEGDADTVAMETGCLPALSGIAKPKKKIFLI